MTQERGFTFIEIMIALVVLLGAMIVLIGLQSAVIQRNLYSERQQSAILLARRILSQIEHSPEKAEDSKGGKTAYDLLRTLDESDRGNPSDAEALEGFETDVETNEWGLPDSNNKPLIQVQLTISWGPGSADRLKFTFLSTTPEPDETA